MNKKFFRTLQMSLLMCMGLISTINVGPANAMMTREDIQQESTNIALCQRGLLRGDGHNRQNTGTPSSHCERCRYLQQVINKNKTY